MTIPPHRGIRLEEGDVDHQAATDLARRQIATAKVAFNGVERQSGEFGEALFGHEWHEGRDLGRFACFHCRKPPVFVCGRLFLIHVGIE